MRPPKTAIFGLRASHVAAFPAPQSTDYGRSNPIITGQYRSSEPESAQSPPLTETAVAFIPPEQRAALQYAAMGWHVFPCVYGKKAPAVAGGFHAATSDVIKIGHFFGRGNLNIGIATGASRLVVIDVDGDAGRKSLGTLAAQGEIPPTYTVRTRSGGHHYYFSVDSETVIQNSQGGSPNGLAEGIDVRGIDGYVIAAPSWVDADHKSPAGTYKIELDVPLAPLPGWLAARMQQKVTRQVPKPQQRIDTDTAAVAAFRDFPPTPGNVARLKQCLEVRLKQGGWDCEEQWFKTLLEMRSLRDYAAWPDDLAWKIFDEWCQDVGGNYNEPLNRRRWDHNDSTVAKPRTFASLLNELPSSIATSTAAVSSLIARQPRRFRLHTVAEIQAMPQVTWRVKGILPRRGLASIYGASSSGKTFLALDCAVSIALGTDWFGHQVTPCPAVYVVMEGRGGIHRRLTAIEQRRQITIPDTFRLVVDHLSLFNDGDIEEFASVVKAEGADNGVIFIDTLNQSALEADENSSKDMGRILDRAQRLQVLTNSLVNLIHHAGKDPARGLRGHSSLQAAMDTVIEVKRDATGRTWSLAKNKDGEDGLTGGFQLSRVAIGQDADGADITSCVVEPSVHHIFVKSAPKPRGSNQVKALSAITGLIQQTANAAGSSVKKIKLDDALTAAMTTLLIDPKHKRQRASEAITRLVAGGLLVQQGDNLWLP